MPISKHAVTHEAFTSFGELLRYLRERAEITQRELALQVGYHYSYLSRVERNERTPDSATILARFVPALRLQDEPVWVSRLVELASERQSESEQKNITVTTTHEKTVTEEVEITSVMPLLATKFHRPPPRPGSLLRARLLNQLGQTFYLSKKITLVSAPAGYGKTTLISNWIANLEQESDTQLPVAWLSLDDTDNDPIQFFHYLTAALQSLYPGVGAQALAGLQSPSSFALQTFAASLLQDLNQTTHPSLLALDDLHVITKPEITETLTFVFDRLPSNLHIVIMSRTDPSLPLPRWRVRDQLTEIREQKLRCTPEEASQFIQETMGFSISPEQASLLEARTEGWFAGLQLAVLSLRGIADVNSFLDTFTGSHQTIVDYLVEEVLNRQDTSTRAFLLQTALFERFCSGLCEAVTLQPGGQARLEKLEQSHLFLIPLDYRREWFRYHHLFGEALRHRLQIEPPEDLPGLHRRASYWFDQNQWTDEAIHHAILGEDCDHAADLIELHGLAVYNRLEYNKLRQWLEALPETTILHRPRLCLLFAQIYLAYQQFSKSEDRLLDAEKAAASLDEYEREAFLAEVLSVRAHVALMSNNLSESLRLAHYGLDNLKQAKPHVRARMMLAISMAHHIGNEFALADSAFGETVRLCEASEDYATLFSALRNWPLTTMGQGRLHKAAATARRAIQVAKDHHITNPTLAYTALSQVLYEWNQLKETAYQIQEAIIGSERSGSPNAALVNYMFYARVLYVMGDTTGAEAETEKAHQIWEKYPNLPTWFSEFAWDIQVWLWLAQGNLEAASTWARNSGLSAEDELSHTHEIGHFALARVLIAQGRTEKALTFLENQRAKAETTGLIHRTIHILALQAMAHQAQGDHHAATQTLERALTLAEPGEYARVFLDHGPVMAQLLSDWQKENAGTKDGKVKNLLGYVKNLPRS